MSKADSTLTKIFEYLSEMDLISQKKTNIYYQIFIVAVALVSFLVAQYQQHFSICIYSTLAALVLSIVVMVPAWPFWKRHSLTFEKHIPRPKSSADKTTAEPSSDSTAKKTN